MKVFISHSGKDQAMYQMLYMVLESKNIDLWDVSKMSPGHSLSEELQKAIRECQICIFIATRRSIESSWCSAELGAFWGSGKPVVLFMADPDVEESVLPPQFRGHLRASTPQQIIDAIQRPAHEPVYTLNIRKIPNRKEMYEECRKLIETSNVIRDTTWGPSVRPKDEEEEKARDLYRNEIRKFMSNGKDYLELVTIQDKEPYINESLDIKAKFSRYECRVVPVDMSNFAMFDLVIGDNNRILFSQFSSKNPNHNGAICICGVRYSS